MSGGFGSQGTNLNEVFLRNDDRFWPNREDEDDVGDVVTGALVMISWNQRGV